MAFFVPMEDEADETAELQIRSGSSWNTVAESAIDPLSRTALFRVEDWESAIDRDYRVIYRWDSDRWGGSCQLERYGSQGSGR